jgi:hypothetical protein
MKTHLTQLDSKLEREFPEEIKAVRDFYFERLENEKEGKRDGNFGKMEYFSE